MKIKKIRTVKRKFFKAKFLKSKVRYSMKYIKIGNSELYPYNENIIFKRSFKNSEPVIMFNYVNSNIADVILDKATGDSDEPIGKQVKRALSGKIVEINIDVNVA